MIDFYKREEFEKRFSELQSIENKESDNYFFKYMKIVLSFGLPVRISERGYDRCTNLYKKWKDGEKLGREEMMTLGFALSDIAIFEENREMIEDLSVIYNQTITKYNPDFSYVQNFGKKHLVELGYSESNPNYMQTIELMFAKDFVFSDPSRMKMIQTGVMPLYDDIKVCPYCAETFTEKNVEELFKHVKDEHGKK